MSVDGREKIIDLKTFSIDEAIQREIEEQKRREAGEAAGIEPEPPAYTGHVPPLEDLTLLPMPGDLYQAHARPVDQSQHMLCLLFHGIDFTLLDYGNLERVEFAASVEPGKSPAMRLLFTGRWPVEVLLTGKNLRSMGSHLRQHRLAWLRQHPTGKVAGGTSEIVITGMKVTPLED